ncbi:MAG: hypothetical protein A3I73_00860 [Omnitrophica bacterium RIFCSPLOWO2_02_FULL_45_16]|nr:MAG: hypothetical protein A3C51_04285 [Omnitrophica bacterium RIFCSPHIGHO2_02_FULL_46_20]OGX00755.1 MAG: hypothetical protein A3I73_00860 [Omnitrophica bacterium RIFCSPLOWO2_02_FULL_45_16]
MFLKGAERLLKESGYDITYNGLYYYRRLGILPEPERLPNSKFKSYDIDDLVETMFIVDILRGIFHLKTELVAVLIKEMGIEKVRYLIYCYFIWSGKALISSGKRGREAVGYIREYTAAFKKGLNTLVKVDRGLLQKYSEDDLLKIVMSPLSSKLKY